MSLISELIDERLKEIERMISRLEEDLSGAPEGTLRISTSRKYTRYYQVKPGDGPAERYLHHSELDLAKLLAQKQYDRKVLEMLETEEQILMKAADYYRNPASEDFYAGPEELVWRSLTDTRRLLVQPITPDTASFVENWQSESYEKKAFRDNDAEFVTSGGIRVRSKTELIIAEMLETSGIPYYYEKPLYLPGQGMIHPDFTVLNVKKRKTMFWEHQGMMDDDAYRDQALERINWYIQAGYYPGIHLILTHETAARPIRTGILKKVIEAYLY